MSFTRTMIEEKGLIEETLEFEVDKVSHHVPLKVVIEFIESCPQNIQKNIKSKLSYIDLKNGNILDFMKRIAIGMTQL